MKILIVPFISRTSPSASASICENIVSVIRTRHAVGICTHLEGRFHHVSLYHSPSPKEQRFSRKDHRSFEGWLKQEGGASLQYLKEDAAALQHAMDSFHPDLIITDYRIAVIPVARRNGIPVIALVHSTMYHRAEVPSFCLKGINAFLSSMGEGQILRLRDLYLTCDYRIGFGTVQTDPFPSSTSITRIGMMTLSQLSIRNDSTVSIFLTEPSISARRLIRVVKEAFLGAPFEVYISYPGCQTSNQCNLHFINEPKESLLHRSSICIHDGSPFITNICHSFAVPQIIIPSTSCISRFHAFSVRRNGSGVVIDPDQFDVPTIYEAYRTCIVNTSLQEHLRHISSEHLKQSDLTELLHVIASYE